MGAQFKLFCAVLATLAILAAGLGACRGERQEALTAEVPLHLEEHIAAARLDGSAVPANLPAGSEWRFDRPETGWKTVRPLVPNRAPASVVQTGEALRLTLSEANRSKNVLRGGVYVDLPGWSWQDWAFVVVRIRSAQPARLTAYSNLRQRIGETEYDSEPFLIHGETVDLIGDGAAHDYLIRADWSDWVTAGSWRQLGLMLAAKDPGSFDLLSVSLVPKEARFAKDRVGVIAEQREQIYRRALYVHAPARLGYRVRVPEAGRLDFDLGVLRHDAPVTFRVTVEEEGGEPQVAFAESYGRAAAWGARTVDLTRWAGRTVVLKLEARSARAGTVALWGAPTLHGRRRAELPNVILYVMDAAGAEYMSAYGYSRRTTPNLERLAAEGALFEQAYSNSTWSKPSTMSFMTSLHHSALGGYATPTDPVPAQAPTMAQLLHRAGYQTAVLTSNTWCGTMSGLEREVDLLRETVPGPNSTSSRALQESFWRWRDARPGEPYWVHFQMTDVHWPWEAVPPVAGVFLSPAERQALQEMETKLAEAAGSTGRAWGLRASAVRFERAGIDRKAYFHAVRGAYDEALAHNDAQLGRLVAGLKARGEWERTLLIVTADHGDWPGLGQFDAWDPAARVPYLNPFLTRVPLVMVWPGRIPEGRRIPQPVSLIDLLPTVLELAGRPGPMVSQGQSLVPLLLGKPGWKPRPVVLEELTADPQTGRLSGAIEMIDGRWGASLAVNDETAEAGQDGGPRLLLYDLLNDPYCLRSVHAERPELAQELTARLERQLREHLSLAKRFSRGAPGVLDSEQLRTLQSLGYIH